MTEQSPTPLPEESDPFYIRPDQPETAVDDGADELVEIPPEAVTVVPDEDTPAAPSPEEKPESFAEADVEEWRDLELLTLAMQAAEAVLHGKGDPQRILPEAHRSLLSTSIAGALNDPKAAPLKSDDLRAALEVFAVELDERLAR